MPALNQTRLMLEADCIWLSMLLMTVSLVRHNKHVGGTLDTGAPPQAAQLVTALD